MNSISPKIDFAIEAHKLWKQRLLEALDTDPSSISPENVAKDNVCPFGQWLYGEAIPCANQQCKFYDDVKTWHAAFHKEADKVMKMVARQSFEQARKALIEADSPYNQVSTLLLSSLKAWKDSLV